MDPENLSSPIERNASFAVNMLEVASRQPLHPTAFVTLPAIRLTTRLSAFAKQENEGSNGAPSFFLVFRVREISSQRLQGAAREFLFQVNVSLITRNELPEHSSDAAMAFGELDHALSERSAPKISVKSPPHL